MNPDNPYAAPQTIETQLDLATLPIAEMQQTGGQRRRFPDLSTAQLQRLFDKSQPLEAMLLVWLALWFGTVGFFGVAYMRTSSSESMKLLSWVLVGMVTARLLCSFMRTKLGRWYMFFGDAALIGVGLVTIYLGVTKFRVSMDLDLLTIGVLGLVLLTVMALAYRSCQTLLRASELFQPVCLQHDDLQRELSYRKEQRID